jgi:hypothetical protein
MRQKWIKVCSKLVAMAQIFNFTKSTRFAKTIKSAKNFSRTVNFSGKNEKFSNKKGTFFMKTE